MIPFYGLNMGSGDQ